MTTIAVVDYGMGNLNSVKQALLHICNDKQNVVIATDKVAIKNADKIVFPGQGAARTCMQAIKQHDLAQALIESAQQKPFLGICMGLQVLMTHSEENNGVDCLDIFSGEVKYLGGNVVNNTDDKIPQMGWNQVQHTQSHPLWDGIEDNGFFYFVHSYYAHPNDSKDTFGTCNYGSPFACTLAQDSIFAVQFHPEKSADNGLRLLHNFVMWDGKI